MARTLGGARRYTRTAVALHWLMALLVVLMLLLGFYFSGLPKGEVRAAMFVRHFTGGVLLLMLVVLRGIWRLRHKPPALPHETPKAIRLLASSTHGTLYALMVLMPLSGWAGSSMHGGPLTLLGGIPWFGIPGMVELKAQYPEAHHWLHEAHEFLAWALIALIVLHVAGALFHHVFMRDEVLLRMAPLRLHGFLHRLRGTKR